MNKTMDKENLKERIKTALELIRPYLKADGGDVSLQEVTDDMTVKVKLEGACVGCPFSMQTLKAGVEQAIRREVPEIKEVVSV
ncbi:MAG: NifU family protein [Bacteroidota bacterium]